MTLKLGMCGFTIGAKAHYKQFRVVEVQQTFYDPPPLETLERWRSEAPPDFEFTMKAVASHHTFRDESHLPAAAVTIRRAGARGSRWFSSDRNRVTGVGHHSALRQHAARDRDSVSMPGQLQADG